MALYSRRHGAHPWGLVGVIGLCILMGGCTGSRPAGPAGQATSSSRPAEQRKGDEIVAAGHRFHTGTPVVLWTDPGGYNAYAVDPSLPNPQARRYGTREQVLSDEELARVQAHGWPLELLREKVDQFVLHYDVAGTSQNCFKILQRRGLSVHFMLDLDGTIYQTCDLQERTYHATKSNPRSIGIEIANMGAYRNPIALKEWYTRNAEGQTVLTLPSRMGDGGICDKSAILRPDRNDLVSGEIHGVTYRQYDLTPQQYRALAHLTAALGTLFPRITLDYPKDTGGQLLTTDLSETQWAAYTGVLGHYHVQHNKQDPGPAFQWDRVIREARSLMTADALRDNNSMRGEAVPLREKRTGLPEYSSAATAPASLATRADARATDNIIAARLHEVLHRLDGSGAVVSARVIDSDGRTLYADRDNDPVIPASNLKLSVTAAALDRFGPDHEFKTYLAIDGDDLWLIGTGDPGTGDPALAKARGEKPTTMLDQWAAALKARGISRVAGNLYYYDGAFEDRQIHPSWSRDYLTDWYAAPVSGLNFNDNCIDVTASPKASAVEVEVVPPTQSVQVINRMTLTGGGDKTEAVIERKPDENRFTISGPATRPTTLESKAVLDPGAFFADALRTNLRSHGIEIAGQIRRADRPLGGSGGPRADQLVAVHKTSLRDILKRINKNSQNLFAEALCKYQGQAFEREGGRTNARGSWENGEAAVKAFLQRIGVDPARYTIADGSGLSRLNRVTTRGQTELLLFMSRHPHADVFRQSLAITGVDGTIAKRNKAIAGRVFAKTGYIGGVRALSGYIHTRDNRWLTFSIIYNRIPGDVKPYEALQDEACRLLHDWPGK